MIIFKVKDLLKERNMSRYRLQKLTKWNYQRINAYFFGTVIDINIAELDTLCKLFQCTISDIIEFKEDSQDA